MIFLSLVHGHFCSDAKQLASEFVAEGATANKAFHARSILSQVFAYFPPSLDLTFSVSGGSNQHQPVGQVESVCQLTSLPDSTIIVIEIYA